MTPQPTIAAPAQITQRYRQNPFSPRAYGGFAERGRDFVDQDFTYVSNLTLTSLQLVTDRTVSIDNDSDFEWRAVVVPLRTATYEIQLFDAQNNPLSNTYISYLNFQNASNGVIPYPLTPAVLIPMSGVIKFNIRNLTAAPNVIQIGFRGVKRYRYQVG
jgi:hypothetical protein